jgi:hypothetical protein
LFQKAKERKKQGVFVIEGIREIEKAIEKIKTLKPGVLNNLFEISQFWMYYKNPLEPIIKKGYDSYLKANGQSRGIKSYNDMVGLVVAYLEKESK